VIKKTKEYNKQLSIVNSRVKKSIEYMSRLKKSVTENNKMVTDLKKKIVTSKSDEQKTHIEEEIRIVEGRNTEIK
jgi:hypothetical protein|tara:strand:- start:61 stop:285 length:225 start_codon:yes stop_codon:yes gene_type:complete